MTISLRKTRSSASNAVCREMHYVCIVLSRRESVGPRHSLIRARASISSSGNLDLHGSGERSWKTYTAGHYEFLVAFEPLCPALFHPFSLLKSANSGRWKEINRECQKRRERDLFIITCGVCRVEFDGRPRKKVFFHRDLSARVSSRRSYVTGVAFVPLLAPSSTIGASNGLNFDKFRTCEKKCSCNIDVREVNVEYRPPCKCFEVFFFFLLL